MRDFDRIRPLLPLERRQVERSVVDRRVLVEEMLWTAHTVSSWQQLPERHG